MLVKFKITGQFPNRLYGSVFHSATVFCGHLQVNCEGILVTVFFVSETKRFLIRKQ